MSLEIALAYFHFVALIGTASLLVTEVALCRPGIQGDALHRLKRLDVAYFSFAMTALLTGGLRVFFGAKGSAYYLSNPVFHAKLGLFVAVALLSITPTLRFIQWSKAARQGGAAGPSPAAVGAVRRWLTLELLVLSGLPLMGTLLSHGVTSLRA